MNRTNYRVTLDIKEIYSTFTVSIKRGDTSGRLLITLMSGGKPFQIPEGCYATFESTRPDDAILHDGCIIQNNMVIYDMDSESGVSDVAGKLPCEITLYSLDGTVLVSPQFAIMVYETVFSQETVESSNEYKSLTKLILEANTIISDVETKLENGDFIGEKGDAATIRVGSVTTGEPNTEVKVENSGDEHEAVLDFTIPKGKDGVDGKSAYQTWLDNGNTGSEADFLKSLIGASGNDVSEEQVNELVDKATQEIVTEIEPLTKTEVDNLWNNTLGADEVPSVGEIVDEKLEAFKTTVGEIVDEKLEAFDPNTDQTQMNFAYHTLTAGTKHPIKRNGYYMCYSNSGNLNLCKSDGTVVVENVKQVQFMAAPSATNPTSTSLKACGMYWSGSSVLSGVEGFRRTTDDGGYITANTEFYVCEMVKGG